MGERIGLYGGSFNPIHHGHLIVARAIAEQAKLARLIWLCSAQPPHKVHTELVEARHRGEMVRLAINGEPGFDSDDFDLSREGPTYTIDTVRHLQSRFGGDAELFWIIGEDSLVDLNTWRDVPAIMDVCKIVTVARPGARVVDWSRFETVLGGERVKTLRSGIMATPVIDISGTEIRRRVHEGRSIRYLVPESVAGYIARNGLYRQAPSTRPPEQRH